MFEVIKSVRTGISYGCHQTMFGNCLIGMTSQGIIHLSFMNDDEATEHPIDVLKKEWPQATSFEQDQIKTEPVIRNMFDGTDLQYPLLVKGTNFQVNVWRALASIPEGTTQTYENIASVIGKPKATRAVGNAVGKNRIALLIPCHRVVSKSRRAQKYRWGPQKKKAILDYEAQKSSKIY